MGYIILGTLAFAALAVAIWYFGNRKLFYVSAYQRALLYKDSVLVDELEPGVYKRFGRRFVMICEDMREKLLTVPGQELMSKDGATIRVSLIAQYRIEDLKQYYGSTESALSNFYAILQIAVREAVVGRNLDSILTDRELISSELFDKASSSTSALGIALSALRVRDITVTGEVKKSLSEVLRAKYAGISALERARGETAALRNLANAAELLSKNADLLKLRALQTAQEGSGNSIVLNFGDDKVGRAQTVPPAQSPG